MLVTDQISGLSDSQLVDKYKSTRDYNYIGILFQRHTQFVYAVSMKYLKDQDKSKDAVMEIFEKLVNDLLRFDIENFKGWLHQVTKNHCLLTLRSEKYQRKFSEKYKKDTMVLMEKPDVLYQENDHNKESDLQLLEKGIETLNEEQKTCIRLFYLKEKSYAEVAQITGYTMNNVKSFIQNGKRNLKIYMEKSRHSGSGIINLVLLIILLCSL